MQRPKFQVQQKLMDFSSKMERVIAETFCKKHDAERGDICFHIVDDHGIGRGAICGPRSRQIYTGPISDFANRTKRSTKEHR